MRFLPLLAVMALIFLLSHTPGNSLPESRLLGQDKILHVLAYATLAAAALWAWLPQVRQRTVPALWAILLFCTLYGISDEFHQSFIPGRFSSLGDILADIVGAAVFLLSWFIWNKKKDQPGMKGHRPLEMKERTRT